MLHSLGLDRFNLYSARLIIDSIATREQCGVGKSDLQHKLI